MSISTRFLCLQCFVTHLEKKGCAFITKLNSVSCRTYLLGPEWHSLLGCHSCEDASIWSSCHNPRRWMNLFSNFVVALCSIGLRLFSLWELVKCFHGNGYKNHCQHQEWLSVLWKFPVQNPWLGLHISNILHLYSGNKIFESLPCYHLPWMKCFSVFPQHLQANTRIGLPNGPRPPPS